METVFKVTPHNVIDYLRRHNFILPHSGTSVTILGGRNWNFLVDGGGRKLLIKQFENHGSFSLAYQVESTLFREIPIRMSSEALVVDLINFVVVYRWIDSSTFAKT